MRTLSCRDGNLSLAIRTWVIRMHVGGGGEERVGREVFGPGTNVWRFFFCIISGRRERGWGNQGRAITHKPSSCCMRPSCFPFLYPPTVHPSHLAEFGCYLFPVGLWHAWHSFWRQNLVMWTGGRFLARVCTELVVVLHCHTHLE